MASWKTINGLLDLESLPETWSDDQKVHFAFEIFAEGLCRGFSFSGKMNITLPWRMPDKMIIDGNGGTIALRLETPESNFIEFVTKRDQPRRQELRNFYIRAERPCNALFLLHNVTYPVFKNIEVNGRHNAKYGILAGQPGKPRAIGLYAENVKINRCTEAGVKMINCGPRFLFERCGISGNKIGFDLVADEIFINNSTIEGNEDLAVKAKDGYRISITNTRFEKGWIDLARVELLEFHRNTHTGGLISTTNVKSINVTGNRLQGDTFKFSDPVDLYLVSNIAKNLSRLETTVRLNQGNTFSFSNSKTEW